MSKTPEAFGENQSQFKTQRLRPLNPIGQWAEDFRMLRGITSREMDEKFNLHSLHVTGRNRTEDTSLYTLEQMLQGAEINGATESELASLADAVEETIAITLEKKGKLYGRIPPLVPRTVAKELPCVTFTDTQLSQSLSSEDMPNREKSPNVTMVGRIRKGLGFSAIITEEQAQKIKDEIASRDEKRAEKSMVTNEFALGAGKILGKDPTVFKDCPWILNRRQLPNPEQFGAMLETSSMTKRQRKKIINYWLDQYRETISLEMLGKEYVLTRARMHQIKKRLGYKGNSLSWKVVEEIREYKRQSAEGIIRAGRPVSEGTMFSLAKEFGVSASSVGQYVDRLDIKDRKRLSSEDIEKIRNYRRELLEMGGTHKTNGAIAQLAVETGTSRTSIYRAAISLGINPTNPSDEDLELIRQYRNTLHT